MLHLVDGLILTGDKKMSHESCHKIVNKKVDEKIAQQREKYHFEQFLLEGNVLQESLSKFICGSNETMANIWRRV